MSMTLKSYKNRYTCIDDQKDKYKNCIAINFHRFNKIIISYRKTEFYSMNWNIENTQLISANFGGPIGNYIIDKKVNE